MEETNFSEKLIVVNVRFVFTKTKAMVMLMLFFFLGTPLHLGSEQLSLTTYYPAPYGIYNRVKATRYIEANQYLQGYLRQPDSGDDGFPVRLGMITGARDNNAGIESLSTKGVDLTLKSQRYVRFVPGADNKSFRIMFGADANGDTAHKGSDNIFMYRACKVVQYRYRNNFNVGTEKAVTSPCNENDPSGVDAGVGFGWSVMGYVRADGSSRLRGDSELFAKITRFMYGKNDPADPTHPVKLTIRDPDNPDDTQGFTKEEIADLRRFLEDYVNGFMVCCRMHTDDSE